jgi:hypothetical protein
MNVLHGSTMNDSVDGETRALRDTYGGWPRRGRCPSVMRTKESGSDDGLLSSRMEQELGRSAPAANG